jgi:hypothetical protein
MADNEASLLLRIKQVGGEILDNVTDKLKEMGKAVLVVGSAIAAFGTYAIKQFKESEAATNSLNQSLVQQGIYTKALAGDYKRMAEALAEKSLFQDEEITQAQAIIQNQIGQKKISQELMQATLNLAAAKKMDLASAAELVGKTLGTETKRRRPQKASARLR